jgi:signal transduction histidine kinase
MPKLEFSGERPGEAVQFVFRRHLIAMRKGFYAVLIGLAVGSIPFLIWQDNVALLWLPLIGLALGLLVFFYQWIGWYFSIFIVTNQRLRQISQKGLFGKSVIDLGLAKVQNISYNIPGMFGEMFGFGTIVLQTMVGDLVINKVANCEKVYDQLSIAITDAGGLTGPNEFDQPDNATDQTTAETDEDYEITEE